jgi:hypothetical protein
MVYKIKTSSERYNDRMDKIWGRYREQQRQKEIIAKKVYKLEYDKLSNLKKKRVDYIWGDLNGI